MLAINTGLGEGGGVLPVQATLKVPWETKCIECRFLRTVQEIR